MNLIHQKLLTDLEIENKIIPKIDNTITIFGHAKFKELFNVMYINKQYLYRRRQIIEDMINNSTNRKILIDHLENIKEYQNDISWLFSPVENEYKDLYCKTEMFNTCEILTTTNYLKIYSPSFIIIVYFIIYIFFWYYGMKINIGDYVKSIYLSYKILLTSMLAYFMDNINMISFLTNLLATLYVFYQLYTVFNSFEGSLVHYNKCNGFKTKFKNIKSLVNEINLIYENDVFLINEKELLKDKLNNVNTFLENSISSLGNSLISKTQIDNIENDMNSLLQYVGIVDSFINIALLVKQKEYTFPTFIFDNDKPIIHANDIWSPHMPKNNQVKNDCLLGHEYNNIILTGPNTSGKSTYIRSLMLSILLAQTLGITCCEKLIITPFTHIFTYLDIPNITRDKESLFEAEVMRCMEYCDILENIKPNEFTFTIIDELFTGTNPKEGIASSYAVCEYVSKFTNSLNIVTTHFTQLTELEEKYPDKFKNMKFYINKYNNTFNRPYKITNGKSDQCIAIELLKHKGYNSFIIDRAIQKLKDL